MDDRGTGVPRLPQPYLGRAWLRERLDRPRPVAVVRGPSGFGKTSAVVDWLRHRGFGDEVVAWVRPPRGADQDRARALVAGALAARPEAAVLVVDELDNVPDDRFDQHLLDVVRSRAGLRLITCVYSAQRFPPHVLLDLDTTVIDAAELLLTSDETAALAEALDPRLPAAAVRELHLQCGGWPAVTRASLVAASDGGPGGDVASLVDRIAAGYVRHHLLALDTEHDGFLPLTALPELLTAEAVDELAGPGSSARLERLVAAGLLLRSDGPVYEWPAAARRALRAELVRRRSRDLPELHRRLAERFLAEGQPGAAVAHAIDGGDRDQLVRIIDASWRVLLVEDRAALRRAVTSLPAEALAGSRRATAMRDVILQPPADRIGSVDELPRTTSELEELARTPAAADELDTALAVLVAFRNCAPLPEVRDYARRLLAFGRAVFTAHSPAVAGLYPSVLSQVGVALMAADAHGEAEWPLLEAFRLTSSSPFDYLPRDTASKLALLHALSGDTRRTEEWLRRYDAAPAPSSWLREFIRPVAATARLLVALDRLDLAMAQRLGGDVLPPLRPERSDGLFLYARALLALHDGTAADLLDELAARDEEQREREERGLSGAGLLAAAEADLQLALGRGNQARAVLTGPHANHPALRVGQARLALLTGQPADAVRLAADPAWERTVGHRARFEMRLIAAVAAVRTGDRAAAVQSLRRAVDAAGSTGTLRPFVLVPRAELASLAREVPGLAEILSTPAVAERPDVFPRTVPLVTLTVREQLVIEKLAAGLTLQQTADALVVSYHTIRTQQASIYRKLGVDSRPDAVARARQWGLL